MAFHHRVLYSAAAPSDARSGMAPNLPHGAWACALQSSDKQYQVTVGANGNDTEGGTGGSTTVYGTRYHMKQSRARPVAMTRPYVPVCQRE